VKKAFQIILIVVLAAVFLFSSYKFAASYMEYAKGTRTYNETAERYVVSSKAESSSSENHEESSGAESAEELEPLPKAPISVDFDRLTGDNPDVVGWIYSEGTPINYPIAQSGDNSYYLRRLLDGTRNANGTVFLDYRCERDFSSPNNIIYGHNMKNDAMFGTLMDYQSQEFYEEHSVMWLLTPGGNYMVALVAGYSTPGDSDTYYVRTEEEGIEEYLRQVIEASVFSADPEKTSDRLLVMSTCSYEYDESRFVLVGYLIQAE